MKVETNVMQNSEAAVHGSDQGSASWSGEGAFDVGEAVDDRVGATVGNHLRIKVCESPRRGALSPPNRSGLTSPRCDDDDDDDDGRSHLGETCSQSEARRAHVARRVQSVTWRCHMSVSQGGVTYASVTWSVTYASVKCSALLLRHSEDLIPWSLPTCPRAQTQGDALDPPNHMPLGYSSLNGTALKNSSSDMILHVPGSGVLGLKVLGKSCPWSVLSEPCLSFRGVWRKR